MQAQLSQFTFHKVFIAVLAFVVLFFPARIIHTLVTSTTDQNLFHHPHSHVLFSSDIAIDKHNQVKRGDYLVWVEDQKIDSIESARTAIPERDEPIKIEVVDAISEHRKQIHISSSLLRASIQGIPGSARIISVDPDGASDRAGIKPGDLIVSINDKPVSDIFEADAMMRKIKPGEVAIYRVLRRLEPIDCKIRLADFGIPHTLFLNILGGILFFIPGIVLGLLWSHTRAARRLSEAFLLLAGFSLLFYLNISGFDTSVRGYIGLLRLSMAYFGIAALIQARYYFPSERTYILSKKWISWIPWTLAVLGIIFAIWGYPRIDRLLVFFISNAIIVIMVCFTGAIRLIYKKKKTARDQKVGQLIRWSEWIFVFYLLLMFVNNQFLGSIKFFALLRQPAGYLSVLMFFSLPVIYAITIFKHRLLGIQFKMDRNTQYTVLTGITFVFTTLLGGLWFLFLARLNLKLPEIYVTGSTIELVEGAGLSTQSKSLERLLLIGLGLLGVWFLRYIFIKTRFMLRKRFNRQGYDYKTAAQQLTEALFNRFNIKSLTMTLAGKIAELMEVKNAGVIVFNERGVVVGERGMTLGQSEENHSILQSLRQFLKTFHGTFSVDYLDGGLKKLFNGTGIQYLSPIRSQNEPLGCLLIGSKRAETCLDGEDFNFLKAASAQSAIAIENALLYNKLASQERMKHELEIARQVQLKSLPTETPVLRRFDIAAESLPALEVGGDYFDYLNVEEKSIHLILADVSGKGTSAAIVVESNVPCSG